jgi:hypothetical protein
MSEVGKQMELAQDLVKCQALIGLSEGSCFRRSYQNVSVFK